MQVPFAAALLLEHGVQSRSVEGDFLSHRSLWRAVEVFCPHGSYGLLQGNIPVHRACENTGF